MPTLLLGVVLLLAGCASEYSGQLTGDERRQVIDLAVQRVTASGLVTAEEAAILKAAEPTMRYYMLAGKNYAQYSIAWSLSPNETVTVFSNGGEILTLKDARIERKSLEQAKLTF